ncbi:hypothetical protein EV182_007277, partial [Spiromyces aspiralis]
MDDFEDIDLGPIWLEETVPKMFAEPQNVLTQIRQTTSEYPSLVPQIHKCEIKPGIFQNLICIDGTLPIMYRGAVFNIP